MKRVYWYNIIGSDSYTGVAGEQWKADLRDMLLSAHPDWYCQRLYEDTSDSIKQMSKLFCQIREGRVDLIIIPSITVFDNAYTFQKFCADIENHDVAAYFQGEDIMFEAQSGWAAPRKPIIYGLRNAVECKVVQRIFSMYASGNGLIRILNSLKADCIPSPKITRGLSRRATPNWTNSDVKHILQNPIYVKIGMIDEKTWKTTCSELINRAKIHFRQPQSTNPFAPLLVCGVCGNHFTPVNRRMSNHLAL